MPQFKMNFSSVAQNAYGQPQQQRQSYGDFTPKNGGFPQWKSQKNVFAANTNLQYLAPTPLPLGKVQQAYVDSSSPMTKQTAFSSNQSDSVLGSDEDLDEMGGFDSPISHLDRKASAMTQQSSTRSLMSCASKATKTENGWKKKVKTELCRFWLNGQACENSQKEQGCGFAHGQEELQKKKGLSRQYLTSVCKNFLEHPSKCTYGQRCIF